MSTWIFWLFIYQIEFSFASSYWTVRIRSYIFDRTPHQMYGLQIPFLSVAERCHELHYLGTDLTGIMRIR